MYKLICMAFDGDYKIEAPVFKTITETCKYNEDLGSRWFFYPFYFITSESCKTIYSSNGWLYKFEGRRTKTVAKIFETASEKSETIGMDVWQYEDYLIQNFDSLLKEVRNEKR